MNIKKIIAVTVSMIMTCLIMPTDKVSENIAFAETEIWNGTYDTSWYDEEEAELHISTAEELAGLSELVNAGHTMEGQTIYLDNDIYLNDVSDYDNWETEAPVNNWTSVGDNELNGFYGIFDGKGNSIIGLYQNKTQTIDSAYGGLFGYITGYINNVKCEYEFVNVETIDITVPDTSPYGGNYKTYWASSVYAGGICGYISEGEITNCLVKGNILSAVVSNSVDSSHGNASSGGICGGMGKFNNNGTIVKNCCSYGTIESVGREKNKAGGICGELWNASINGCYSYCNIYSNYSGGICGTVMHFDAKIQNCYNQGIVNAEKIGGGILGYAYTTMSKNKYLLTVSNVYNTGIIYGNKYAGGIIGSYDSKFTIFINACYFLNNSVLNGIGNGTDNTIAKNSSNMQKESFVESLGEAFVYNDGGYPLLAWELELQQEPLMGDVNLDGIFDIADIKLLQDYLVCRETLTAEQGAIADVYADNVLNCFDLCVLKRMYLEQSETA